MLLIMGRATFSPTAVAYHSGGKKNATWISDVGDHRSTVRPAGNDAKWHVLFHRRRRIVKDSVTG